MEHDHHPKEIHHNGHHRAVERRSLKAAVILTGTMMVVEAIGGILTNSLALLSDAFHMLTHSFALGVSLVAILLAVREAPEEKSYGYWRIEILSALFNGITLLPIMGYIFYEAYKRFLNPEAIKELPMFLIALVGLAVNIISAFILHGASREDINVRAAFIHLIGDTASSVGVVLAAGVIYYTKWYLIDPLMSVIVALIILAWSIRLIYDSVQILLEASPRHIGIGEVKTALMGIDGVEDAHDLHLWTLSSKMYAMTAHVAVPHIPLEKIESLRKDICKLMDERFDVNHVTIQFEFREETCV